MSYVTYTDEHLEYWADVYRRNKLIDHGIRFEYFIQFPVEILKALYDRDYRPLLPEQVKVAARIRSDDQMAELQRQQEKCLDNKNARCNNGVFIEPLHYTRFPRKAPHHMVAG